MMSFLKKLFTRACVYNTFAVIICYSLSVIIPSLNGLVPKLSYIYMLFVFSLGLSLAGFILRSKINGLLRVILHYIIITVVFYSIFIVWGGFAGKGTTTVVVMVIYTAVYAVIMGLYALIHRIGKKKIEEETKYEEQFSSTDI